MTPAAKAVFPEKPIMRKRRHYPHGRPRKEHRGFQHFARLAAKMTGRPIAFAFAFCAIIAWAILGPIFHFSDTWQLVINTATTIITFLIVFLIQNTQNRDSEAIQIKLDELLRATKGCHNAVLDIEELSEHELDQLKLRYTTLAKKAAEELRNGKSDLGIPDMKPEVATHEHS
jgi:low affinity Fe/Cu permease